MTAWSRIHSPDEWPVFTRPLGPTEAAFYWDTIFSGTSDTLQQIIVDVLASQYQHLFSHENIKRTWLALKQLHPLLGASVREHEDANEVDFMVDAGRLDVLGSDEIIFKSLHSDAEARTLVDRILNEPRSLSNERPAQIWIITLPQDNPNPSVRHQVFFHLAHYICDGVSQNMIIRSFFDILVQPKIPNIYVPKQSLSCRVGMLLALEDLHPQRYSPARQRWRDAIALIIQENRKAAMRGGHTLPRRITPGVPAISRTLRLSLSKALSRRIVESCRRAQITFGHALAILAQVAHTRVLHRLKATMSKEEWAHRIRQPMHVAGPLNLRPYLDSEWFRAGNGGNQLCIAIGYFSNTLPSMPSPHSEYTFESPGFEKLLSRAAFFHRCQGAKKQTNAFMAHPLFPEMTKASRPMRAMIARATALTWRANGDKPEPDPPTAEATRAMPLNDDFVMSNGCSSMGNVDGMLPPEYPIKWASGKNGQVTPDPSPLLRIGSLQTYLRCRPAELYLTSISYLQIMELVVFCDIRAYDEALARKWLGEVGRAAEWYLGGTDEEKYKSAARL